MINALLVIHIILAVCMIGLVLVQKSEGGALGMGGGSGGGMGGFMSARGTANLLTRTTAVLATLFFLTTLGLAVLYKGGSKKSILEDVQVTKTSEAPIDNTQKSSDTSTAPVTGALDPAEQAKAKKDAVTPGKTTSLPSSEKQKVKKEAPHKTS